MSNNLAEDIARKALRIDWWDTEMAARRVAEYAATRIKELEANINLKADFIDATINQLAASDQRIEKLEAKLARALELALDECPFRWGTSSYEDWWHHRRTIIAELSSTMKGQGGDH